ncbi:hypothetical protein D3C87_1824860 [compost metagenome]
MLIEGEVTDSKSTPALCLTRSIPANASVVGPFSSFKASELISNISANRIIGVFFEDCPGDAGVVGSKYLLKCGATLYVFPSVGLTNSIANVMYLRLSVSAKA